MPAPDSFKGNDSPTFVATTGRPEAQNSISLRAPPGPRRLALRRDADPCLWRNGGTMEAGHVQQTKEPQPRYRRHAASYPTRVTV